MTTAKELSSRDRVNAAAEAEARSGMYEFLASVYRSEPTAEMLERMERSALGDALQNAGVELGQEDSGQDREPLLLELATEYTRLFIGPGAHISPHESVHVKGEGGGRLNGEATVAVRQFIESAGFNYHEAYRGLPDHISVELEFLQSLVHMEARSIQELDMDTAMHIRRLEAEFILQHLACWAPQFCEKAIEAAGMAFYREMARLTRDFINTEKEWAVEQIDAENGTNAA